MQYLQGFSLVITAQHIFVCVIGGWREGGGGMGGTEEVHKSAELEYLVPNKWDLTC